MWSWIKRAARNAWRFVKAVVRVATRIGIGIGIRTIHIIGSLLDPIYMVKKKLRIQVLILSESGTVGLVPEQDLDPAINRAKQIFLDKFKIEIRPYSNPIVQTLSDAAPASALATRCALEQQGLVTKSLGAVADEFGEAGEYFAGRVAGWVGVPISLQFPVTVFVVRTVKDKLGCSIPIADYVTLVVNTCPALKTNWSE